MWNALTMNMLMVLVTIQAFRGVTVSHLLVLYAFTHTVFTLDFHFDYTFSQTFTSGTAQLYTHSHRHMHTHCHQHKNHDYYNYNPVNHVEVLI